MRIIFFAAVFLNLSFGAVWSTTSMAMATGTISALVGANMAAIAAQVVDIKSDFDSKAVVAEDDKTDYISKIESLEAKIMVQMRIITDNQEKINILYLKDSESK